MAARARPCARARSRNAFAPARFTAKWAELKNPLNKLRKVSSPNSPTPRTRRRASPSRCAKCWKPRARRPHSSRPTARWPAASARTSSAGTSRPTTARARPLSREPVGTLILAAAHAVAEDFAPVSLLALLKHPLVRRGRGAIAWLAGVRSSISRCAARVRRAGWRASTAFLHAPADKMPRPCAAGCKTGGPRRRRSDTPWTARRNARRPGATAARRPRCAGRRWMSGPARRGAMPPPCSTICCGHAPRRAGRDNPGRICRSAGRACSSGIAVRPPAGGHHRIAIRGLIESRLQSADLIIAAGLNEGTWPAEPAPDPWLAPQVRMALGMGAADRRIGIAAHDLASVLGAREVLLTRAETRR